MAREEEEEEEEEEKEDEEEEEQEEVVSEFNTLFNRLIKSVRTPTEPPPGKAGQTRELVHEEEGLLDEGLVRACTMEDLEALVHDGIAEETAVSVSHAAGLDMASEPQSKKKKKEIDPSEVLTKDANVIKVPLAPALVEGDEGEEEEVSEGMKTRLLLHLYFLLFLKAVEHHIENCLSFSISLSVSVKISNLRCFSDYNPFSAVTRLFEKLCKQPAAVLLLYINSFSNNNNNNERQIIQSREKLRCLLIGYTVYILVTRLAETVFKIY